MSLIAVYVACFVDHTPRLSAGEIATVACIAADRRQARVILRYILGFLRSVPTLAQLIEAETADSITLKNRVQIEVATASWRVTRGYSFAAVICDEIAFWRSDEASAVPDTEILRAIRPGLSNLNGLLLLASSPYAQRGALWAAFKRHYGKDDARVLVWRAGTLQMNPSLDPRIVEEAREEDPQAAAAEYDAVFRTDVSGFLTRDQVDAAVESGRTARPPQPNTRYVAFADPSSGSGGDSFTAAVAHLEGNIVVLDCIYERRPPFNPASACAEIADLLKSYRIHEVTGDKYAAGFVISAFKSVNLTYRHSDRDRSTIYCDVLPLFTSGRVLLLDHPRMAAQFIGLERRTGVTRDRVDHSPGQHDDICNSVAGALTLVSVRPPMRISAEAMRMAAGNGPRLRTYW
jgi:hypothetical protein